MLRATSAQPQRVTVWPTRASSTSAELERHGDSGTRSGRRQGRQAAHLKPADPLLYAVIPAKAGI